MRGRFNMTQNIHIFFLFKDFVQCFNLPYRHSLILNEIEVDIIAKESIHDNKSQLFSIGI